MSVTLKLKLHNELRRVSVSQEQLENFKSLQEFIRQTFIDSLPKSQDFNIKYKDDEGDMITVSSDLELQEALKTIQNGLLRFDIALFQPQRPQFQPNINHRRNCPPFFQHIFERFGNQASGHCIPIMRENFSSSCENTKPFHLGIICDGCEARNFSGVRYNCRECTFTIPGGVDFCENCVQDKNKMASVHSLSHHLTPLSAPHGSFRRTNIPTPEQKKEEIIPQQKKEEIIPEQKKEEIIPEQKKEEIIPQQKKEDITPQQKKEITPQQKKLSPFQQKLAQLSSMGFADKERNIFALLQTKGDLVEAIKLLVE